MSYYNTSIGRMILSELKLQRFIPIKDDLGFALIPIEQATSLEKFRAFFHKL